MPRPNKIRKSRVIGAEFDPALLSRIDDFRKIMETKFPGSKPTASAALRALVVRGLEAAGV